jgi:TonB-dependent receptor
MGRIRGARLRASSLLVLAAALASPAFAQDPPATEEEIVVTGYRRSLADALETKRTADNVVEAIAADDLGRLPDVSIGEALARLPGLATNRDRGNSTEISVRGLGPDLSNTFLNGREIVSGEPSRNVRYEQYPSELLSGAIVYKSPVADQLEGGIGGSVNLLTTRPLDFDESRLVANIRQSYNDIADDIEDADSFGYTGSFSYIDQFADGTVGVVLGYARRVQPIATARTNIFPYTNSFADLDGDGVVFDFPNQPFDGDAIPFGYEYLIRGGEDVRDGVIAAVQIEPGNDWSIYADLFYSTFDFFESQRGVRVEGLPFGNTFSGATGTQGFITGITATQVADFGLSLSNVNETFAFTDELWAGGINVSHDEGPWTFTGDLGYSWTQREAQFVSISTELAGLGHVGTFGSSGGVGQFSFGTDMSDPSINLPASISVPTADTITDELASFMFDVDYDAGDGFITAYHFGVRGTDRSKELIARSYFDFSPPGGPVPPALLGDPLQGFGDFANLPPSLTFDIPGVIDLFGGIFPFEQPFNEQESWVVDEDTISFYAMVNFEGDLFGVPYRGNLGVRHSSTDIISRSTTNTDADFNGQNDPLRIENSYDDTMPSLNVSFLPSDNQIIRLALARTIARAPLDNMNAGFGVFNSPPQAFGGNPNLEPFRADQIDLTYEHYFDSESALTFGVFYKDIDTFIVRLTRQNVNFLDEFGIDLVGLGLAATNIGTYTQPGNGEGGYIAGAEIGYQQPLTFLPAPFDGLGVYANYTYVESDVQLSPEFVTGSFPLPGLSENNVNLTLWYFKAGFEARVAYRYRDAFATELGDVPDQILYTDAEAVVDFQTSYEFQDGSPLDGLKLLFQVGNVTDEPFQTYYGIPEARGRYESFGRRYWWGISYEF